MKHICEAHKTWGGRNVIDLQDRETRGDDERNTPMRCNATSIIHQQWVSVSFLETDASTEK